LEITLKFWENFEADEKDIIDVFRFLSWIDKCTSPSDSFSIGRRSIAENFRNHSHEQFDFGYCRKRRYRVAGYLEGLEPFDG
jgi:hypothetical protein